MGFWRGYVAFLRWGFKDMFTSLYGMAFFVMFLEACVLAVIR